MKWAKRFNWATSFQTWIANADGMYIETDTFQLGHDFSVMDSSTAVNDYMSQLSFQLGHDFSVMDSLLMKGLAQLV